MTCCLHRRSARSLCSPRGVVMRCRVQIMARTQSVEGWREARQAERWRKENRRPITKFIDLQHAWPGHDFNWQMYLFARGFASFAFLIRCRGRNDFLVWLSPPPSFASLWLVLISRIFHLVLLCESPRLFYIRFFVFL